MNKNEIFEKAVKAAKLEYETGTNNAISEVYLGFAIEAADKAREPYIKEALVQFVEAIELGLFEPFSTAPPKESALDAFLRLADVLGIELIPDEPK